TPAPPVTSPPAEQEQDESRSIEFTAGKGSEWTWDDVISITIPAGALPGNSNLDVEILTEEGPARSSFTLLSEVVQLSSSAGGRLNHAIELNLQLHDLDS